MPKPLDKRLLDRQLLDRRLLDQQLARLSIHRRLQRGWIVVLRAAVTSCVIAAVVITVIRLAVPAGQPLIAAVIAAALLIPWLWWPQAWRQRDRDTDLAGHLDTLTDSRGLVMALAAQAPHERDDDWENHLRVRLEQFTPPAWTWPSAKSLSIALVLLVGAWAMPQHYDSLFTSSRIAPLFATAHGLLQTMQDEQLATPEKIAELTKDIERIESQAEHHGMTQATWQAKDRLEQRLKSELSASTQQLADALALAEVSTKDGVLAQPAQAALAARLAALAAQAPGLHPKIPADQEQAFAEALAKAEAQGLLSPQQRQALERLGLRPAQGALPKATEAQQQAMLESIRKQLAERAERLGTCRGCEGTDEALAEARRRAQGGDPSRGPGVGDHPTLPTDRFDVGRLDDLPPGARVNPDGSITLAEQTREPDETPSIEGAAQAALQTFNPAAADARRATTSPRHRNVVGTYFAGETGAAPAPTTQPISSTTVIP